MVLIQQVNKMVPKSFLSAALAGLALCAVAGAQTTRQDFKRFDGPVGKVHYDMAAGKVTKVVYPRQQGGGAAVNAATPSPAGVQRTLIKVFCNTITTGYFSTPPVGTEWVDWASKSGGGTFTDAVIFGYATIAADPTVDIDLNFYSGTTGFCTLGTQTAGLSFSGLPGVTASVPPGYGAGFFVTAFLSPGICIPDGRIGWGYCGLDSDGSGGSLTGPILTDFGTNTGWNDAFDFWSACPASTGTCLGAFFFGGCSTGAVPPPPTGIPCASFMLGIVDHFAPPAACVARAGITGCNFPFPLVLTAPPVLGGVFKAAFAGVFGACAVTPGPFPIPGFKLAGLVKGELLADITVIFGGIMVAPGGVLCIPLPKDHTLVGFPVTVQCATFLGPGCFQLTTALDCVLGG